MRVEVTMGENPLTPNACSLEVKGRTIPRILDLMKPTAIVIVFTGIRSTPMGVDKRLSVRRFVKKFSI